MRYRFRATITEGPIRGSFFLRAPVEAMSVGRANDCRIAIADPSMSRNHFSLSWDGNLCRIRDLETTNGTAVNGFPIKETQLTSGDTIIAGSTIFKVFIEPDPDVKNEISEKKQASYTCLRPLPIFQHIQINHPVLENKLSKPVLTGSLLEKLLKQVEKDKNSHWYAIIDGAKAANLAYQAKTMGYPVYTLFMGESAQDFDLASVGPCIVNLHKPLPFLEQWLTHMGDSVGVLLQSKAELDVLYAHLRNIFIAQDEEGRDYFFRFYDPRVLSFYLPMCSRTELEVFFGVIDRWFTEDWMLKSVCVYDLYEKNLKITKL